MKHQRVPASIVRLIAAAALAAMALPSPQATAAVPDVPILIAGGTVIDGTGGPAQQDSDILVMDGKIVAVGRHLSRPKAARVVDGRGKYVIPGLIDAHVHLEFPMLPVLTPEEERQIVDQNPRAFLYNGVTTVMDAGALLPWILKLRDAQRAGLVLGPRIFSLGTPFTPEGGWGSRHGFGVKDADAARARVRAEAAAGVTGLKVMVRDTSANQSGKFEMPPQMLKAIVDEAHVTHQKIYVHALSLSEYHLAVGFGVSTMMHGLQDPVPAGDPLIQELSERHIPVVQTISLFESFLAPYPKSGVNLDDPILRASVPSFVLDRMRSAGFMDEEKQAIIKSAHFEPYAWAALHIPIFCQNISKMYAAGVKIGVGTDAGGQTGYNFEGYNTPWEMASLVRCGLPPMAALVAATESNAEIIGVADKLGTIEPGKVADLLVLSADPLRDIGNVRAIELIVQNGELHHRSDFAYQPPPSP